MVSYLLILAVDFLFIFLFFVLSFTSAVVNCHLFPIAGYMPPGPPNGTHKPGLHPAGFPMPRVPLPPFQGGPPSQPYAIPSRGAVHGPVGAVHHVPPPGSRGFGAGRGSAGAPIGSHLQHQQNTQQPIGTIGSTFNFPSLENSNSQPSVGGPLTQPGFVNNVCTFLINC